MMNNKSSTFISGVLAFGVYFVLLTTLLFYFNMREENKPIHYVKKNEDRIRVSMASPKSESKKQTKKVVKKQVPKKVQKKKVVKEKPKKKVVKKEVVKKKVIPKKVVKKKVIKEKVVKKVKPPKKKKETKPKDLFANVTANKKPEKKRVYKPKDSKPKVSASELFNNSIKVQKPSDRGIEIAYLAKVEEKLNGWPAQSEYAGEKAKVSLKIQTNGKFTFKVITGSSNPDFNEGLIAYLKQLQRFGFGSHKGGRSYAIDVEFVATE